MVADSHDEQEDKVGGSEEGNTVGREAWGDGTPQIPTSISQVTLAFPAWHPEGTRVCAFSLGSSDSGHPHSASVPAHAV